MYGKKNSIQFMRGSFQFSKVKKNLWVREREREGANRSYFSLSKLLCKLKMVSEKDKSLKNKRS
jgi:hypothetical protein